MLTLHYSAISSNCQKVRFFLEEAGIPYQLKPVDLRKGEQLKVEYRTVNPLEAVPAIELDGFCLSESNAILRYLAQRFDKQQWYPTNLEDRARCDQALDFVTLHVSRWISAVWWHTEAAPKLGYPSNPSAAEDAKSQLGKYLPRLERLMSMTTSYLGGAQPSIADAAFAPSAAQAKSVGLTLNDFPLVRAYVDRLTDRPAWKKIASAT